MYNGFRQVLTRRHHHLLICTQATASQQLPLLVLCHLIRHHRNILDLRPIWHTPMIGVITLGQTHG